MNSKITGLMAVGAMMVSLSAHAQLTSTDNGAAATDANGLMWANTVGVNLGWSTSGVYTDTAQAWVAGLNTSNYGGYNNWMLATGDGSVGANAMSNQLAELFYTDCGNSLGQTTALNNSGRNCTALSALTSVISTPTIFFSGSASILNGGSDTFFWMYQTPASNQGLWTNDTVFSGGGLPLVGLGDALAVRAVSAPEIDPTTAFSGLTLLLGTLVVMGSRRNAHRPLSAQ